MKYGCYCDLCEDDEPTLCVVDDPEYTTEDCVYANRGIKKEDCEHWRPIKPAKPVVDHIIIFEENDMFSIVFYDKDNKEIIKHRFNQEESVSDMVNVFEYLGYNTKYELVY